MAVTEKISLAELDSLTRAIRTRYGLDFTGYEVKSLQRGFGRVMSKHKISSTIELWGKVLREPRFIMSCVDDLTVNLTELLRNEDFWVFLQQELKERDAHTPLRIWHAGCSTGEEVYSMGMVAAVVGMAAPEQYATDINQHVLKQAEEGTYNRVLLAKYQQRFEDCFPGIPFQRFFEVEQHHFRIKPHLRTKITFDNLNLVTEEVTRKFDVIFCRNVLIYFDDTLKLKVLQKLYNSIDSEGILILGYYDVLPAGYEDYFGVYQSKYRIYIKK